LDLDISSPPIIHNLKINEKIYEVVIAVTKAGNTIILERNTGRPIFDITYRAAPKSKIKGITTSPFQIDLKKPERFSKIEFDIDDISKLSKEKQSEIINILKDSNYGWFETPSFEKNLVLYGIHGGATWMGAAIDPINQNLFIPVHNIPWIIKANIFSSETDVQFPNEMKKNYETYIEKCSSCHGIKRNGKTIIKKDNLIKYIPSLVGFYIEPKNVMKKFESIEEINNKHNGFNLTSIEFEKMQKLFNWWDKKLEKNNETYVYSDDYQFRTNDGLPASNPPWGYIAKLDLVSGKILYRLPVGNLNIKGKKVTIGTLSYGGTALNGAGILFVTGTEDLKAYAFDSNTGETLWSYEMEAAGSTPPIIFNSNGKQYVSFLATGGIWDNFDKKGSTLYTFTISD
jgi:quinoprotein glucose dehydrogenase